MATAMVEKNLLAGTGYFDRSTSAAREFAGTKLVAKGVAFAAKAATDVGRDNPHMRARQIEHFADFAVDIMGRLRRSPEGQFAADGICGVGFPISHTGVFFNGRVIITFVVKPVFTYEIGCGKTSLDIAKFIGYGFVDIANASSVINFNLRARQSFVDTHQSRENLVVNLNELQSCGQDIGIKGSNCGDRVTNIADLVDGQGILILTGRKNTEFVREVLAS
jgi:hypothetical protein